MFIKFKLPNRALSCDKIKFYNLSIIFKLLYTNKWTFNDGVFLPICKKLSLIMKVGTHLSVHSLIANYREPPRSEIKFIFVFQNFY